MKTKPITLSNGLILVRVPKDAEDFNVTTVGLYFTSLNWHGKKTHYENRGYVELPYDEYGIVGEITKEECSFNCSSYINNIPYSPYYSDYLNAFKSMIEAETDFLFENPIPKPIQSEYKSIPLFARNATEWLINQTRVIEKLVVLKEVK